MDQVKFYFKLQRRLRRRNAWPPFIGLSSLCKDLDFSSQDKWGLEEWRRYAKFLEKGGHELLRKFEDAEQKIRALRNSLTRKKPGKRQQTLGLMAAAVQNQKNRKRPGRKLSSRLQIANEMLVIKEKMQSNGGRGTDKEAMNEWRRRAGHPGGDDGNRLNAMSELRRLGTHNNSSR